MLQFDVMWFGLVPFGRMVWFSVFRFWAGHLDERSVPGDVQLGLEQLGRGNVAVSGEHSRWWLFTSLTIHSAVSAPWACPWASFRP